MVSSHRLSFGCHLLTILNTLALSIVQERSKATRIQMVQNSNQEVFIKLQCMWKLFHYLPNTVNELQEYRRTICI